MSKDELWKEIQGLIASAHNELCTETIYKCGCEEYENKLKEALYV